MVNTNNNSTLEIRDMLLINNNSSELVAASASTIIKNSQIPLPSRFTKQPAS
jgi:hypothetical protein